MGARAGLLCVCLIAACAAEGDGEVGGPPLTSPVPTSYDYGEPPVPGDTPTSPATAVFAGIVAELSVSGVTMTRLDELVAAGDARHAWLISDLLRFSADPVELEHLTAAFVELTSVDPHADPTFAESPWKSITDHLIAWDLPAPPDYQQAKAALFTLVEPRWTPFFDDVDAAIDWRWVSWGGVLIDDRPLGATNPCLGGCIPALDDPVLTAATGGDWYPDDAFVFGIVEGDDVVALPKHIMEIHEMVNMTIGGRRFGIPYCTLCGSAQAYFTDAVPEGVSVPVLRTSGLLSRSNKVMYDLTTLSVFDTFTGAAVSGPLQDAGVVLEPTTVAVTTWGEWKAAHPDTRIVAEDGGIGRSYDLDPLRGRDDDGPIFPTGDVDPRLPAQEPVVGVITEDGAAVAFPAAAARAALAAGDQVAAAGVELLGDGGGLRARTADGSDVAAHEAFWFAWSQFHPETELWSDG
ncbi:MAG: DUF3179 domain-containing (seleno)protein [Ilumatobacteraceae bacterium]